VDIGGGTADISLKIHSDLGMTNPVVCVDPCPEMLQEARKNGATTVQATAEEFLACKPQYPLKVVLMNSVLHHFTDKDYVFTKLTEYMPDNGVCFVTLISSVEDLPLFEALEKYD
jgi:ubiquinone/menaquinone biosynthesis C-methylase UbiE